MKRIFFMLLTFLGVSVICVDILAQDTIRYQSKGYKLDVVNNASDLDGVVLQDLVNTYFTVYPVLARNFNIEAVNEVIFFIDPSYDGVAEAGGNRVRISSNWLKSHPDDFDLVTHEVMHLVQAYPDNAGPWWITEGIADYIRYIYGCDNAKGGWALTKFDDEQRFDKGYRITARFFLWIERKKSPGLIKKLDFAMRDNSYSDRIWKKETGKTVEDLWAEYAKDPAL